MLRNWLLGVFAVSLWVAEYAVYFARDIAAWWHKPRQREAPEQEGPLHPPRRFPPPAPPPHPVQDAEILPPRRRR